MSTEFELIGRISATINVPQGVTGIGDDCAIIPQHSGFDSLVTTDLLIEGRHFLLEDVTPFELGWKSAAVNISDIAAMGGKPTGAFLSIALPKRLVDNWIDEFVRGFNELCGKYGVALLGGDTSASDDKLFINITLIGECPHGRAVMRSGARPGDLVCVTGPLGDSAAGLKLVLERTAATVILNDSKYSLIRRHYMPMPRVEMGQKLAALPGVHAMMDISDGIASDLRHILEASGAASVANSASGTDGEGTPVSLTAEIDLQSIPMSPELRVVCAERGWDAEELAVSGGEDYELLFTAAPGTVLPEGCTVIGRIVDSRSQPGMTEEMPGQTNIIRWIGSDKDFKGFTHF